MDKIEKLGDYIVSKIKGESKEEQINDETTTESPATKENNTMETQDEKQLQQVEVKAVEETPTATNGVPLATPEANEASDQPDLAVPAQSPAEAASESENKEDMPEWAKSMQDNFNKVLEAKDKEIAELKKNEEAPKEDVSDPLVHNPEGNTRKVFKSKPGAIPVDPMGAFMHVANVDKA